MNPLLVFLIQTFAPVVAQALSALIDSIQAQGNRPDDVLGFAVDVVGGLEHSAVPPDERRDRAADAVSLWMRERSGVVPGRATVNAVVEVALQQVRAGKVER